jgi:hypothetical protein
MPKAFSIANGLDWETEIASFWAWFQDTRDIVQGRVSAHGLVQELVASQMDKIDDLAEGEPERSAAELTFTVAVALVGFHYASLQKLIDGMGEAGVFQRPRELPAFDTISRPIPED